MSGQGLEPASGRGQGVCACVCVGRREAQTQQREQSAREPSLGGEGADDVECRHCGEGERIGTRAYKWGKKGANGGENRWWGGRRQHSGHLTPLPSAPLPLSIAAASPATVTEGGI